MSVDREVGILGNGNLDTQSFMHSQETNVMCYSPEVVSDWMEQLEANQSTRIYGKVDDDGIWRDSKTGEELKKPDKVNCFSAMYVMATK